MSTSDYGFSPSRKTTADKLKDITPTVHTEEPDTSNLERADVAGAALGFVSRDSTRILTLRKRKEVGPTVAINMRVPEAVADRFIRFCEQNRLSYWEGVDELMKRGHID